MNILSKKEKIKYKSFRISVKFFIDNSPVAISAKALKSISDLSVKAESRNIQFERFKGLVKRGGLPKSLGSDNYFDLINDGQDKQHLLNLQKTSACKKGCYHCCVGIMAVPVNEEEMKEVWESIKNKTYQKNQNPLSCPALDSQGECQAEENKPSACKNYYSTDVDTCVRISQYGRASQKPGSFTGAPLLASMNHCIEGHFEDPLQIQVRAVELKKALKMLFDGTPFDEVKVKARLPKTLPA